MVGKWLKISLIGAVCLCVLGSLLFGKDLVSYIRSSAKSVRSAVKNAVPLEFELKRAHDLLEEIIPEMHANIRLIAQEEVEVAALNSDINNSKKAIDEESKRIAKLGNALRLQLASYTFGDQQYTRYQVKKDLADRFERFKEAELVLASKERLKATREKSLQAAVALLEQIRSQKRMLANKISSLESQYRLVKASAVGSRIHMDNSKLAQTEKLIAQIKKRLDVAERILAHESRFVQSIPVDTITEQDLLTQVDEYFSPTQDNTEDSEKSQVAAALQKSVGCQ